MNRRSFALAWGRKMFFGIGWPLISAIGLNYLQSQILPTSTLGFTYFLSTFFGQYGLLTGLVYFLLYFPVIYIFPSYYFSRVWAIFLIMMMGLFVLFDTVVFLQFSQHVHGFLFKLIADGGGVLFKSSASYVILITVCVVVSGLILMRGNFLWLSMQRRFSNPSGNWYLVLILVSLLFSHIVHIYADANGKTSVTRLAQLYPLYRPATGRSFFRKLGVNPDKKTEDDKFKSLFYPAKKLNCSGSDHKNVLIISIDGFRASDWNEVSVPSLHHYSVHGAKFLNHHSGGTVSRAGIFTLFYGLPTPYWKTVIKDRPTPVLLEEAMRRQYGVGIFTSVSDSDLSQAIFAKLTPGHANTNSEMNVLWKSWLNDHFKHHQDSPFFGYLRYSSGELLATDLLIREVVEDISRKKILDETIIIITGASASETGTLNEDAVRVPLLIIWPEKQAGEVSEFTSHYDLSPTIMKDLWKCTNPSNEYSFGASLFDAKPVSMFIMGDTEKYGAVDYETKQVITIKPDSFEVLDFQGNKQAKSAANEAHILEILKQMTRFRKK